MAAIKSAAASAKKWATVTPMRAAEYEAGVQSPRRAWAQATLAAEDAWRSGIQEAITQKSFSRGVQKTGDAGWQSGAIEKGVPRWGPGVALAEGKYEEAVAPYFAAISRLTLPPRFARRDKRNMARVTAVVDALVAVKTGRSA
jgi:hypothetical protein